MFIKFKISFYTDNLRCVDDILNEAFELPVKYDEMSITFDVDT